MTVQIGGSIGPFLDNVQQRQVPVIVAATCEYSASQPITDPVAAEQHIQAQMLRAIRDVIAPKMANGALSFRHLGTGDTAAIVPEIIALSGLPQQGIQISNLNMAFGIDGRSPQPAAAPAPAAPAQNQGPEIRAHIHVGGLNINASTSGGVDTAGLKNQIVDKAKSAIMWYAFFGIAFLVVILGVGLVVLYAFKSSSSPSSPTTAKWDGKTPFTCGANDVVVINGATANLPGTAITANGSCNLTLVNVDVTAATAIEAGGNAAVTVQGGKINGSTAAVHAGANAKVTLSGTKVTGKTQAVAAAKITGPLGVHATVITTLPTFWPVST